MTEREISRFLTNKRDLFFTGEHSGPQDFDSYAIGFFVLNPEKFKRIYDHLIEEGICFLNEDGELIKLED